MKKMIALLLILTSFAMAPFKKNTVVFFGDSITQMGVNKGGYIDRIQNYLQEKNLQENYQLIGAGIGGNKVYDLYLRMEEDVMDKHPNTVVIYVGINDVWHKTSGTGTDIDKYEKFYIAIIKKLQAKKINVLLCTPTVIGEKKNGANPQDADLDAYSNVIRKLATTYQYEVANNKEDAEKGILTTDRVHLNDKGNQLVADEMMKALQIVH
jgi:isoamyl acetate esterase